MTNTKENILQTRLGFTPVLTLCIPLKYVINLSKKQKKLHKQYHHG
jgi:hypothetical protein